MLCLEFSQIASLCNHLVLPTQRVVATLYSITDVNEKVLLSKAV